MPTGALAKAEAPLWTVAVSALTVGYLGRMLQAPTVNDWEPMWVPYLALLVAPNFLLYAAPPPVLLLALAGGVLAFLGDVEVLKRRFYLPLLFDKAAPAAFNALWRLAALADKAVDRALQASAPLWRLVADAVTLADWLVDAALHDGLVALVRRASAGVAGLRLDYYLYVAGLAAAIIIAVAIVFGVWR